VLKLGEVNPVIRISGSKVADHIHRD